MKNHCIACAALFVATCISSGWRSASAQPTTAVATSAQGTKMYAIPSWGDIVLVHGPGTDSAMDSNQAMENTFRMWKGRGFTGVFLRSDLQQFDPMVHRNPRVQMNPGLARLWAYIDDLAVDYDYYAAAQKAADKVGFEFWAFHPYLFSDGAPETEGVDGPGRMVPWSYVSKSIHDHPEIVSIDRKGNKYWMVPEYGYEVARKDKVAEFVHMAKKYGIKHFLLSLRSEVSQLIDNAAHADQYGFNKVVVDDMKRLYNVDIMTDPRFDVDSPTFKSDDPMVQNWRNLRGGYFTQLLRDTRKALDAIDPKIEIGVTLSGEAVGPPLGNWKMDWRTWVDEGLVDMIVTPTFFEGSMDPDADKKGYLTHARLGIGTVSNETLNDYIKKSKHPDIQVIQTGGPYYQFTNAPAGTNGFQTDVWYSSYHKAWYQRWNQWMRDVNDFGHIKYLEQNFDKVSPKEFAGISGGWGMFAYDPKIRAASGVWWRLGDGTGTRPFAQSAVKRGKTGQAIQMGTGADSSLTGWHMAGPDRTTFTGSIDSTITNGIGTFDFWLMRKSADSGMDAFLQGDGTERDLALRIAPKTGKVSYSTGAADNGDYNWVETEHVIPVGQWQKVTIETDLDRKVYSAYIGDTNRVTICNAVPLTIPKERIYVQHGDMEEIKVPAWKQIKQVLFSPTGSEGSINYLDDVSLRWKPTTYFKPRGSTVEFAEDFEKQTVDADFGNKNAKTGFQLASDADSKGYFITNDTSYGEGVKALQARGGSKIMVQPSKRLNTNAPLNLDLDLFLLSSKVYYNMIPNRTLKAPHRTVVGLAGENGNWQAAVQGGDVYWKIWDNGQWKDTSVFFDYDAWNHVQIALDGNGSYQVVVQPVGQMPMLLGQAKLASIPANQASVLMIDPPKFQDHVSLYDNLLITSGDPVSQQSATRTASFPGE